MMEKNRRDLRQREGCVRRTLVALSIGLFFPTAVLAADFFVRQIADESLVNREPVINEAGHVAWHAYAGADTTEAGAEIYLYDGQEVRMISQGEQTDLSGSIRPQIQGNTVVWQALMTPPQGDLTWILREVPEKEGQPEELPADYVLDYGASSNRVTFKLDVPGDNLDEQGTDVVRRVKSHKRHPSGDKEIVRWRDSEIMRVTEDQRNDLGPSFWGDLIAWQKAKGWPFGWEIMIWDDGHRAQLTTNYYYDMAPRVHGRQVTWYGWDGHDFEIFLYDREPDRTIQITSNHYDDVSPVIWDGVVVWEAYPAVEADVFVWKDGVSRKLSDNIEDDVNPRIWNGQVVWQGFDGDDFEIYLFDLAVDKEPQKITSNLYDDLEPDIRDGLICWMGYEDNWDAEIFVWDGSTASCLTTNDYEDRAPRTAGGRVVWQADHEGRSQVFLAVPERD